MPQETSWTDRLPFYIKFEHVPDSAAKSGAYASLSLGDLQTVADVAPADLTVDQHVRPMLRSLLWADLERRYPRAGIRCARIKALCAMEHREPMPEERGVLDAADQVEKMISRVCGA